MLEQSRAFEKHRSVRLQLRGHADRVPGPIPREARGELQPVSDRDTLEGRHGLDIEEATGFTLRGT